MVSRRVVITGIGLVSPVGIGTSANWRALLAGTSGVARITKFDPTGFAAQIAAEVKGFDPLQFVVIGDAHGNIGAVEIVKQDTQYAYVELGFNQFATIKLKN